MEKLLKSNEVYNRIKWQSNLDIKDFFISYFDRVKNNHIKVPFNEWIPLEKGGDIPWHRVYYIYNKDKVLWDREKRIYNEEMINDTTVEVSLSSNIKLIKYDDTNKNKGQWKHVTCPTYVKPIPETLNVVSYNCLFDIYETTPPLPEVNLRLIRLFKLLENLSSQPDIILLQEITPKMKDYILSVKYVQDNFYTFDYKINKYNQMTLSKYMPTSQNIVHFPNNIKCYHKLTFKMLDNKYLQVFNIHLTSATQKNSDQKRKAQMKEISNDINVEHPFLIGGDFNSDEDIKIYEAFDIWTYLHPKNPGATYNTQQNILAELVCPGELVMRTDRILSSSLIPKSATIIGQEAIDGLYISDHYGVMATLTQPSILDDEVINLPNALSNTDGEDLTFQTTLTSSISSTISTSSTGKPFVNFSSGTALDIVLPCQYWEFINDYRKLYDNSYITWPAHVTVFKFFMSRYLYHQYKEIIYKTLEKYKNLNTIFDNLTIFEQESKYTLVIIPSIKVNPLTELHKELSNKFGAPSDDFNPHITLGTFKSPRHAEFVKRQVEKQLPDNPIIIKMNHLDFMNKMHEYASDQGSDPHKGFKIYDSVDMSSISDDFDVEEFLRIILDQLFDIGTNKSNDYEIIKVGSKALNDKIKGDHDMIITSNMNNIIFYKKLLLLLSQSHEVKYVEYLYQGIPMIDIILKNDEQINIIYTTEIDKTTSVEDKYSIKGMVDVNTIVKSITKDQKHLEYFVEYYRIMKNFCKQRRLYGSNYCYLNGISLLVMCLVVQQKYTDFKSKYDFMGKFMNYYAEYDFNKPISISNDTVKKFEKKFPSDKIAVIIAPTMPYRNCLRRITPISMNMIKKEINIAAGIIKIFPNEMAAKELFAYRKIEKPYVELTLQDNNIKNLLKRQKEVSATIWKVFLKMDYYDPDNKWLLKETPYGEHYAIYKVGIHKSEYDSIIPTLARYGDSIRLVE
jgi:uncharacterized protein (UPF0248 family)/endonuclease/exonuclease/phosphatase family metal-dependent hydrolase